MTEPIPAPGTCPFCTIATAHPPHPTPSTPSPNPFSPTLTVPSTYLLLSTPLVMAFLDIMPIARGHVLVATRAHRMKLSDVSVEESKALGVWVPVVCRAVMRALGMGVGEGGDWNVVQNNGAKAAQVVPHVHFHIIPRPGDVPEIKNRSWTVFGKGQREELDEDDAVMLAAKMREELVREGVDLEWERARMEKL